MISKTVNVANNKDVTLNLGSILLQNNDSNLRKMDFGADDVESARDGFIMKDSNANSIFGKEFNGYLNERNGEKETAWKEKIEVSGNGGNDDSKRKKLSEDEPEQVLTVMSRLVQELFESIMVIKKLEAEMNRNLGLEDHFKEVIRSQRERFREDVRKNLNSILMGYDKMLEKCANTRDVASKISKMTRLAVEEVESVISLCLQLEDRGRNRGPNDSPGKFFLKCSGREFCVDYSKSLEIIQKKTVVNSKNSNKVGTPILNELLQNMLPGHHRSGPSRENVSHPSYVQNIEHTKSNAFWQQNQRESKKAFHGFRQPPDTTLPSGALNLFPQYVDSSNSNKMYSVPFSNPSNYIINGKNLKHFDRYSSLPLNRAVSAQLPHLPMNCVPQSVANTCSVQPPVKPLGCSNSYIDQRERSHRICAASLQQTTCHSPRGLVAMPSNQRSNGRGPLTQELRLRIPSDSPSTKAPPVIPHSQNFQHLGRNISGKCVDRPFHQPRVTTVSGFKESPAASSAGLPPLTGNREAGAPVSDDLEQGHSVLNVGEILVQVSFGHQPERATILPLESSTNLANFTNRTDRSQPLFESSRGTGLPARPSTNYNAKERASNEAAGKNDSKTCDPTVPQKLTLKNHRLQAGITLGMSKSGVSDAEVNRREPEVVNLEEEVFIKTEKEDEDDDVQIIDEVDNSDNSYNSRVTRVRMCAQGECTNIGVRICKGCCSVIYCSDTCQLKHWRLKHKEECEKLKELLVD